MQTVEVPEESLDDLLQRAQNLDFSWVRKTLEIDEDSLRVYIQGAIDNVLLKGLIAQRDRQPARIHADIGTNDVTYLRPFTDVDRLIVALTGEFDPQQDYRLRLPKNQGTKERVRKTLWTLDQVLQAGSHMSAVDLTDTNTMGVYAEIVLGMQHQHNLAFLISERSMLRNSAAFDYLFKAHPTIEYGSFIELEKSLHAGADYEGYRQLVSYIDAHAEQLREPRQHNLSTLKELLEVDPQVSYTTRNGVTTVMLEPVDTLHPIPPAVLYLEVLRQQGRRVEAVVRDDQATLTYLVANDIPFHENYEMFD